jgi:Zn-dependent metalloprotease
MRYKYLNLIVFIISSFFSVSIGQIKNNPVPNFINPFKNKTDQEIINTISPDRNAKSDKKSQEDIKIKSLKGSFYYNFEKKRTSTKASGINLKSYFSLNNSYSFKTINERTDELGYSHINYQQLYDDIPIDGCISMVHSKNGQTTSINGQIAEFNDIDTQVTLTKESAKQLAKTHLNVTNIINDYPGELCIARITKGNRINYRLAYKVRVDSYRPFLMRSVYVDAKTGEIFNVVNLIKNADVTGTADTYYRGTQSITFDSYSNAYRLRESGRKIETYNSANATFTDGTGFSGYSDFTSSSTSWTGVKQLATFTISNIAQTWWYAPFADEKPDLYIKVKDGSNLTVYTSNYFNDTNPPVTFNNLNILLLNPPYKVEVWDYDAAGTDDFGGSYPISSAEGTQNWSGNGNNGSFVINNSSNPALDVHWGMEKTFDFYMTVLSRNSYDGIGGLIKNFVNPDNSAFDGMPNNAFALSSPYNVIVFGIGDGVAMNPVVGLDVEGHEFTHMVVDNNGNGGLTYQGESGALNESFADIFGTCIEFYALSGSANWTIGENIIIGTPDYLRSMSDPNVCQQPNTYQGQYWANTENLSDDEGGVHTNSGVQNFWFYLLCQGGTGTNDFNNPYSVTAIGMTQARQIAYKTLTTYLPPDAKYLDAYNGSLQAAQDLYGNPSAQYSAVRAAWYAVGIGNDSNNFCSGTTELTEPSGTISDGSGNANYSNNSKCKWVIAPEGATKITLNFSLFDTEAVYDSVIVYNGPDATYPKLMTWWGNTLPPTINSTVGAVCIKFSSDEDINAGGWSVNYTSTGITPTCNGLTVLSAPSGTFSDGSGSGNYGNNQSCYWYIAPPCASSVSLSFSAFATETDYDGIIVYDDLEETNKLGVFTGNTLPASLNSTTGKMLVIFVSDFYSTRQGFTANYTSVGSSYCSGTNTLNTSDFGTLTDGSGSSSYCNNMDCMWLIQPPQATSVTIDFIAFDLEAASDDGKTIYDAVEIYDGATTASPLLGRYTGSNLPPSVTSSGGSILVHFYSDLDIAKQGWSANYTSATTTYCSGTTTLTSLSGTFSDGSGANQYGNNSLCSWLVQPISASSITLSFSEFNTEMDYDGIIIYDGADNTSPILGEFTGTSLPSPVTSTGGSMYLEFLSNPAFRGNGWTANYTSSIITGIDGSIINEYLKLYPNPTKGIFTIESCFENTVEIQIMDLSGKIVMPVQKIHSGTNQIDASELTRGIYIINYSYGSGHHIEQLVID